MNNIRKIDMQQRTQRDETFLRIIAGVREIARTKWKVLFMVLYGFAMWGLWSVRYTLLPVDDSIPFWSFYQLAMDLLVLLFAFIGAMYILQLIATPFTAKTIQENLQRIGFVNSAGESPFLLAMYKDKKENAVVMRFENRGIHIAEWDKQHASLEAALNCYIVRMEYEKNLRYTLLYTVPAKRKLPPTLYWNDKLLSKENFVLVLGKGLTGDVTVNLVKTPHILLGGSTGSGKSILLKSLLMQCVKKGAVVYIADFKGGVDFPPVWHDKCKLVFSETALLDVLTNLVQILEERKEMFRESGCANIDEYNKMTHSDLQRIVFACDEVAELLDKTGLSKADKELILQIEGLLSILARQGRAFGMHIVLATQRPDANVLSGQIKNNLDCRICGKADSVLSQIILDSTEAAEKIPKDVPGKFITNSGVLFQGYLFDERKVF